MASQPVRRGSVVARRYRATRRIASGAMGEVWEGVHVELGQRVALKVLRKEALDCHEIVVRFAREAFLLARIQSEHVVRVIDFVDRGRHGPVLVMELVEGPTLGELVQQDPMSIEESVDVAIDVLRGLQSMHESHVIHRDVKPSNIILRPTGDGGRRAMLIDLGVGRLVESTIESADGDGNTEVDMNEAASEITTADRVVGTIEYMAPEQIMSCQSAGAAVDVYAVGAVLYRAVAGSHPFGDKRGVDLLHEKIHQPVPRLSTGRHDAAAKKFEDIVELALAFAPENRYKSANELLEALEGLRAELRAPPIELQASDLVPVLPPPLPSVRKRARRRNAAIAIAAACATAFAACSTDYRGVTKPPTAEIAPHPPIPSATLVTADDLTTCTATPTVTCE